MPASLHRTFRISEDSHSVQLGVGYAPQEEVQKEMWSEGPTTTDGLKLAYNFSPASLKKSDGTLQVHSICFLATCEAVPHLMHCLGLQAHDSLANRIASFGG